MASPERAVAPGEMRSQAPAARTSRRATRSSVTTAELYLRLNDATLTVVDVRPLAAYNGWRKNGELRGGHVPGAVAFPGGWLESVDEPEIARLLQEKGIVPGHETVLYGAGPEDVSAFRDRLVELGHPAVRVYEHGLPTWAADDSLPVERLPNHHRLVDTEWLSELLAGRRPEAAPEERFLLFHVNFGVRAEYDEAHLPGALYLDTNLLENPADWNRRSPEELEAALRALGITHDTTVVLYGRDSEGHADEKWPGRRAGQISASRAALILHYCGVSDVRLLDGGYDAWVRAGNPLEATPRKPTPVASFGLPIPQHSEVIVGIEEARQILADREGAALVSVRTWDEHIGKVSGYNYIRPAGRIAGDVWGNCGSDAYHMQHYRNMDNTMRAYPEIAVNWDAVGITQDKWVAFYCGTGWRASETWFYAYLMGWPRIAVYDGGWHEWSRDADANPIEVGEPEGELGA